MREYGQIQSAFWQSEDAEHMSDQAKLLACYLLTGPYTNGLGCFRCTDGNLMDDLGWSSDTVSETLSELYRVGFAYRLGKVVFLPNFLRWNGIANPKVAKARLKELETLPTNQAKALAARSLLKFCNHLADDQKTVLQTVSNTVSETVLQTLSKQNPTQPYPDPIQNQNQNQKKEREKTTPESGPEQDETPPTDPLPTPPADEPTGKSTRPTVEIETWLASFADDVDPIPPDDPVFRYAENAGIPRDFLELSWVRFHEDMAERHIRKKDWRQHYRNAVKGNWYKLWWIDQATGQYELTTVGEQTRRAAA